MLRLLAQGGKESGIKLGAGLKPAPTPLLTSWHQNPGRFYLYVFARVITYDTLPEMQEIKK